MKKTRLMFLTSALVVLAVFTVLATVLFFVWYNDTHTGPRSGKVIDAITGRPIEGVVVKYCWEFSVFVDRAMGGGSHITREVLTDSNGQYYIPGIYQKKTLILLDGSFEEERLLVYKDGYAVYITVPGQEKGIIGTSFGYNDRQKYSKRNNVVKLFPFKEGASHYEHMSCIGGYTLPYGETELLVKELKKERERARQEP